MQHSTERILATPVGRLVVAPDLSQTPTAGAEGRWSSPAEFKAGVGRGVGDAVASQQCIGLGLVNYGDPGRLGWQAYAHQRLRGVQLARDGVSVELVGRERVIPSSDCGLGGRIPEQIAWAELEALVQGGALATERARR